MSTDLFQYDGNNREIAADGLKDYYWPLDHGAHISFIYDVGCALVTAARELVASERPCADAFANLILHIGFDVNYICHICELIERTNAGGKQFEATERLHIAHSLAAGKPPHQPSIVKILRQGPEVPRRWRAPARWLRDLSIRDGLVRVPMRPIDLDRDIIASVIDPLVALHAREVPRRVIYQRPHKIFTPSEVPEQTAIEAAQLASLACDIVFEQYEKHKKSVLPAYLRGYFEGWISQAIGLAENYLRALEKNDLPKTLWTGSGGNIWSRLLRYQVSRQGGTVVGHAHGTSSGFAGDNPFFTYLELDTPDEFMAYTAEQAAGLAGHGNYDANLQLTRKKLRIRSIARSHAPSSSPAKPASAPPDEPKVMLVSSYYQGDRIGFVKQIPHLAILDLEARVLSKFQQWRVPAYFKPRLGNHDQPPRGLAAQFGATSLNVPAEQALGLADVVLFTDAYSTAFATILSTDKPVVFIDLGRVSFTPKAEAMVRKRCAIVPGEIDANNRFQVDWDALRSALSRCFERNDSSFVDTYFGDALR